MADALDLGSSFFGSAGSTPVTGTMAINKELKRARELSNAQEKRQALYDYKVKVGCIDCGYNAHHAALEFDHLPGFEKGANVMALCYGSWSRIWAEVAKCEVVCSNCHSIRTFTRNNP